MTFAGDWHLPAVEELKMISEKLNIVQPSLDAAGSISLEGLGRVWTANQSDKSEFADVYNFSNRTSGSISKNIETQVIACFALY